MKNNRVLPFSELHEIALREARKIHRSKVEHGIAIDKFGNIFSATGGEDDVDIPDYILENAQIIVHNHPHDFREPASFSDADVYNLLHYGLDEIIVCGYGWYFSMRNAGCKTRAIDVFHEIARIYATVVRIQKKEYIEKAACLEISERMKLYRQMVIQIDQEYHVRLMQLASEEGLSYMRCKL